MGCYGGFLLIMANESQVQAKTELEQMLGQLTVNQIRYVIARVDSITDKEACEQANINYGSFRNMPREERELIDRAVRLMAQDSLVTALHLRRRALARAMEIKLSGLDSRDEKIRQSVATEIIEWEMGKAMQRQELSGKDGGPIAFLPVVMTEDVETS